jgi:hypothetical protein
MSYVILRGRWCDIIVLNVHAPTKNEMGRAYSTTGEETAYRILLGKPKGKRPLGRPRRRLVNNIQMNLR